MLSNLYKHPSFMCADDVSYLCEPLKKLNISYFAHVRIDHKRNFSTLSSNPEFLQHYIKNKYYVTDIHMANENLLGDFFVWDAMQFSEQSRRLCLEATWFKVSNPFTIIQKRKDGINYYHFASGVINRRINQMYITNIDLLNHFIAYFNDNVRQSKSLSKAYDFKFSTVSKQEIEVENANGLNREEFCKSLKTNPSPARKLYFENAVLSKRQSEILHYIIRGNTLKEIAYNLKFLDKLLSPLCFLFQENQ